MSNKHKPWIDTVEACLVVFVLLFFVLAMTALLAPGGREMLVHAIR